MVRGAGYVEPSADVGAGDETARALARNAYVFRKRMGLTQGELAARADLRRGTVVEIEKSGNAEMRSIQKVAAVFGVTTSTMLERDEEAADALFLFAQYERLSPGARETFHRAYASRAANDKIRPEGRDRRGR